MRAPGVGGAVCAHNHRHLLRRCDVKAWHIKGEVALEAPPNHYLPESERSTEASAHTPNRLYVSALATTSPGFLSSLSPTNFECLRWPSGVHSPNSISTTNSGLTHTQFFISSRVSAHCVRLRSRRLTKRHWPICKPLSLPATSRRVCDTNPFRTLAAYSNFPSW